MNLTNLNRSPLLAFVKGFFKKPAPVAPVDPISATPEDATRTIYLTAYDGYRNRILFRTFVKCPVSAAPARIAARVATIKRIPDRARIWMTDDSDRAQNWQYRYRMIRHTDGAFHARLIDPRTR
jgi:hypothetical protein